MTVSKWWWLWYLGAYMLLGILFQTRDKLPEGAAYEQAAVVLGSILGLWAVGFGMRAGWRSLKNPWRPTNGVR